jgi:hypothetical protein
MPCILSDVQIKPTDAQTCLEVYINTPTYVSVTKLQSSGGVRQKSQALVLSNYCMVPFSETGNHTVVAYNQCLLFLIYAPWR